MLNPFLLFGGRDDDDRELFGLECEEDRALLSEAGYREVRPGWWADAAGAEWPLADALARAKGGKP